MSTWKARRWSTRLAGWVLTGIWLGTPQGQITPLPTYPPELSTNPARTGQACAQIFTK